VRRLACPMIVIDAREGVSGDMLLAAMLGCLESDERGRTLALLTRACEKHDITFHLLEIEDQGEKGLGISYTARPPGEPDASRERCYTLLAELEQLLESTSDIGRRILDHIFDAEAEAHRIPVEQVHLHEIGRIQALVNIAGIGLVASLLAKGGAGQFKSSVITTGGGLVVVSHGAIRIPAPASSILLRGLKHRTGDSPGERATPTGIAAIRALAGSQVEEVPSMFVKKRVGFGTKRFAGRLGRTRLLWL